MVVDKADNCHLLDVPLGTEGEYTESRLSVRTRADATLNLGFGINWAYTEHTILS